MRRRFPILLSFLAIISLQRPEVHAKCLDFRSPFRPNSSLAFCTEYSEAACCGASDEAKVKDYYDYIQTKVKDSDWVKCQGHVKNILCTRCSPFATSLFDLPNTEFPNLCNDLCEDFHQECRHLLWFLDASLAIRSLATSTSRFCARLTKRLGDSSNCYPAVLTNQLPALDAPPSPPPCVCLEKVGDHLANPLFARPAWDGSGRMFVAQQNGRVHIYRPRQGSWSPRLFLNMMSRVKSTYFPSDERGFYSLAFHPDFRSNGRFFAAYFQSRDDSEPLPDELQGLPYRFRDRLRVSELTVQSSNPDKGDRDSEKIVLDVPQPFVYHNGGELFFGDDGYLYVGVGDGGGAGDLLRAGQNKSLLFGKILRLDVDTDPSQPYTIPADNPFVGEAGSKPEIYALGIRNTWRCGMDAGDRLTGESRGRVLCGDVGQNSFEEINLLKKGGNYGWNSREGFECFDPNTCGNIGDEELPITAYNHTLGRSVTGGVFYRGCQSPRLNGIYVYGDFTSSRMWTLSSNDTGWTNADLDLCDVNECLGYLDNRLGRIFSFGEDEDGETYVLASRVTSSVVPVGKMYKLVDPSWREDPTMCPSDTLSSQRLALPQRRVLWTLAYQIQRLFSGAPRLGSFLMKKAVQQAFANRAK